MSNNVGKHFDCLTKRYYTFVFTHLLNSSLMKILFVGATCLELYQFFENLKEAPNNRGPVFHYKWHDLDIDLIITGIGTTFTTYYLTKALHQTNYDLVINAGIAGSFKDEISIGTVVNVKSEQFSDFGIEDADHIKTVFDAGFVDPNDFPFHNGRMINPQRYKNINLPEVHGVTGNISHGATKSISRIIKDFDPDIESMEGAAVFYVCLMEKVPFLEIRAISNYVDIRNTDKWDIPTSIENLTDELFRFLRNFATVKQIS
jgi:futalosine hydrolase